MNTMASSGVLGSGMRRRALTRLLRIVPIVVMVAACALSPAPPGVPGARMRFPPPGASWRTETHDDLGAWRVLTWTAIGMTDYRGRVGYAISDGIDRLIYDPETLSWMATLRDGRERFAAEPHDGSGADWLWPGKRWPTAFTYHDHVSGRSVEVRSTWEVTAYERITVPAGAFDGFRMESANAFVSVTAWYAPEVRLTVRRIVRRSPNHTLGAGTSTTELLELLAPLPARDLR